MHKECEKDNVETDICINGVKDLSYLRKKFYENLLLFKVVWLEKMLNLLPGMVSVSFTGWNLWGSKVIEH